MRTILSIILALGLTSCASRQLDSSGNPINRSLLIDSELILGVQGVPILEFLPDIKLGFGLNFRRPTIQEEIDLNLSKTGKTRTPEPMPKVAPAPFAASEKIK